MKYMEPELPCDKIRTPGVFLRTVKGNWYFLADKDALNNPEFGGPFVAKLICNCGSTPIDREMTAWKFNILANLPGAQVFKGVHKTYEFRP